LLFVFYVAITSRAFINFTNGCAWKRGETSTRASPRNEQTADYRLLPRYLFSGSSKLILQGDSPGGSSPGDYPLLQESASMRNFFFVYVFPRENTFFATFRPIHAQKRILSVIDQREITSFPSYISFWEAGQINWGLGVKGLQPSVLLRCAQLSFVESPRR